MITLVGGAATDVGRVRSVNQDGAFTSAYLYAVADGMGGHRGGEVASALALQALAATPAGASSTEVRAFESLAELLAAAEQANDLVYRAADQDPDLAHMGTTLCALALLKPPENEMRLGLVNIGDSRVYRWSGGELEQLTEDHSLVQDMVRDGRLTAREAETHPKRNILTRALGIEAQVVIDGWDRAISPGERYLLCSDGLFNELDAEEIAAALADMPDPLQAAHRLVDEATAAGGRDNVTCVVVDVVDTAEASLWAVPEPVMTPAPLPAGVKRISSERSSPAARSLRSGAGSVPAAGQRRVTFRVLLFFLALLVVMAIGVVAVPLYARGTWFLGFDRQEVVVFHGRPDGVLWISPTVAERSGIMADVLPPALCDGISRNTLATNRAAVSSQLSKLREDLTLVSNPGALGQSPCLAR